MFDSRVPWLSPLWILGDVLKIDGGNNHVPLNIEPAFAVKVVGDGGYTSKHVHFQAVLNLVLAGEKEWTFDYPP